MLRAERVEEHAVGFIQRFEEGTAYREDIRYCKVVFDISQLSHDTNRLYGINLPPHIVNSVTKRRAEYIAGRICCKRSLEHFGETSEVASLYPDRQPGWPPGFTGSISHCGFEAIAIVTTEQVGHVGVDIEQINDDLVTHASFFASQEELERSLRPEQLLVIFSAKEALFKALYPKVRKYFGFECAFVTLIDSHRFSVELTCSLSPELPKHRSWIGHYCIDAKGLSTTLLVNVKNPT